MFLGWGQLEEAAYTDFLAPTIKGIIDSLEYKMGLPFIDLNPHPITDLL